MKEDLVRFVSALVVESPPSHYCISLSAFSPSPLMHYYEIIDLNFVAFSSLTGQQSIF